ncbi:MAG: DUF427 domain-containing protein [Acidobacteriota bacterium]
MVKAVWNGEVLAESDDTVVLEGTHYFPPASVKRRFLIPSDHRTTCHWKGEASYFHLEVDGQVNANAAWLYSAPNPAAAEIRGRIAFWKGVQVGD